VYTDPVVILFLLLGIVLIELCLIAVMLFLCLSIIAWTVSGYIEVPFVPTPKSVFPHIVKALVFEAGDVVYDLGSGDGRFLIACARLQPGAQFIGIERNMLLHAYALCNKRLHGSTPNVHFRWGNFFHTDLSNATKIYAYLLSSVMDALLPQFEQQLKGTRIASRAFKFSKKSPAETVQLSEKPGSHNQHMLYVYDF